MSVGVFVIFCHCGRRKSRVPRFLKMSLVKSVPFPHIFLLVSLFYIDSTNYNLLAANNSELDLRDCKNTALKKHCSCRITLRELIMSGR